MVPELVGFKALAQAVRACRPDCVHVGRNLEFMQEALGDYPVRDASGPYGTLLADAARACAQGCRAFVATTHGELLGMVAELRDVALRRLPLVLLDVCEPEERLGSLSLLDHGWIQCYARDAAGAADMVLSAFRLAEFDGVSIPVMVNVDREALAKSCPRFMPPAEGEIQAFLPPRTVPVGLPPQNRYQLQRDLVASVNALDRVEEQFSRVFGRSYDGAFEEYECDDARHILVTAGSLALPVKEQVDALRLEGQAVGMVCVRYLRPFDGRMLAMALSQARSVGVFEPDVSFGTEGTLFTNVNSALHQQGLHIPTVNFIAGLHGEQTSGRLVRNMFKSLMFADSKAADVVQLLQA